MGPDGWPKPLWCRQVSLVAPFLLHSCCLPQNSTWSSWESSFKVWVDRNSLMAKNYQLVGMGRTWMLVSGTPHLHADHSATTSLYCYKLKKQNFVLIKSRTPFLGGGLTSSLLHHLSRIQSPGSSGNCKVTFMTCSISLNFFGQNIRNKPPPASGENAVIESFNCGCIKVVIYTLLQRKQITSIHLQLITSVK